MGWSVVLFKIKVSYSFVVFLKANIRIREGFYFVYYLAIDSSFMAHLTFVTWWSSVATCKLLCRLIQRGKVCCIISFCYHQQATLQLVFVISEEVNKVSVGQIEAYRGYVCKFWVEILLKILYNLLKLIFISVSIYQLCSANSALSKYFVRGIIVISKGYLRDQRSLVTCVTDGGRRIPFRIFFIFM